MQYIIIKYITIKYIIVKSIKLKYVITKYMIIKCTIIFICKNKGLCSTPNSLHNSDAETLRLSH